MASTGETQVSEAERQSESLKFTIKEIKIVGFPSAKAKKLIISVHSPSGSHETCHTDTKTLAEHGCSLNLQIESEKNSQISIEVFRHRPIWCNTLVATAGISIGEMNVGGASEYQKEMVIYKRKSLDDRLKLTLKTQHSALLSDPSMSTTAAALSSSNPGECTPRTAEDDSKKGVASVAKVEDDPDNVKDEVERARRRTEKCKRIYETADTVIETLDTLSEIHEIARVASIVVSGIYRIIKAKHEQDEAIVGLYDVMIETFKIAVDKKVLNERGYFTKLFDEIVRQSEECYVFLSNYMFKGVLHQVSSFWNTPSKIAEFNTAFEQLKKRFVETQIEFAAITIINTQKAVESLEREKTLRPLEPSETLLGPKCHCLPGTRRSSLSTILDWCFNGKHSVLWISGIAGCGKSSLIGTLHNTLSTLGFHGRLAAFIRFDRSTYKNAGEFVKALAFLLANFDERFGKPIAEAILRSRHIAQNTDLSAQVEQLLINPLQGLSEDIAKEGRIVVLVDGIDESSREDRAETKFREQLLELFADNRFKLLPFLRFVLASRPEEDIVRSLQRCSHIHHFPLDHTSPETRNDIHYFLTKSFQHSSFDSLDTAQKHDAVERLAERASGLFIWAATVVGFIKENVAQRLKVFTENEPPKNALHALTVLYETALNSLIDEQGDDDIRQNICMALGLIMANSSADPPCSVDVLHALTEYMNLENNTGILSAFKKLRSLVTEEKGRYQLLHKSFDDFLTSEDRARRWYIDLEKYNVILAETILTYMMDHLDKMDTELPEALSSDVYRYASAYWLAEHASASYQQKEGAFLLRYVLRWMRSLDEEFSGQTWSSPQYNFGNSLTENGRHDSEFMQKAITGASRLGQIGAEPIVVNDFFNIMLYDAALAGKVTKTNTNGQFTLEWEIDNIYMSVFILMAGGSNVYEEIVAVLDTNPIPPVVPLDPETEMPIKIVSQGKIRMNHSSVDDGDEGSTKEFIEWIPGEYVYREGRDQFIPDEAEGEDSEPSSSGPRDSESEE
ncbi:hypothetical protein VNI00_004415 [Paramarasmius palmivorus]|uniref:NACHT domain-containing protein n=1 Tax=Paramarasmius palmivorus TaxID=297713 RepID=A0AAW0DKM4_9AGAR